MKMIPSCFVQDSHLYKEEPMKKAFSFKMVGTDSTIELRKAGRQAVTDKDEAMASAPAIVGEQYWESITNGDVTIKNPKIKG